MTAIMSDGDVTALCKSTGITTSLRRLIAVVERQTTDNNPKVCDHTKTCQFYKVTPQPPPIPTPPAPPRADSRDRFEAFVSIRGLPFHKTLMGKYVDETTEWCWQTWMVAYGLDR